MSVLLCLVRAMTIHKVRNPVDWLIIEETPRLVRLARAALQVIIREIAAPERMSMRNAKAMALS